jgi:hypothetical protein
MAWPETCRATPTNTTATVQPLYRKLHPKPCEARGRKARLPAETWELPILAQLGGIEPDDGVIARVVAALGSTVRPIAIDRSRIERQMRELALDLVAGGISDETYLEHLKHLRASLGEVEETAQVGCPRIGLFSG